MKIIIIIVFMLYDDIGVKVTPANSDCSQNKLESGTGFSIKRLFKKF